MRSWPYIILLLCMVFYTIVSADDKNQKEGSDMVTVKTASIELKSDAFKAGEDIPRKYTCDGAGISPPLSWNNIPDNARELVLIVEDPDAPAGNWAHWVVYGLSPDVNNLSENIPKKDTASGFKQGKTTGGGIGYEGPCPPRGSTHRYFFRLYALDKTLDIKPGSTRDAVRKQIEGHIAAQGELMGRYSR